MGRSGAFLYLLVIFFYCSNNSNDKYNVHQGSIYPKFCTCRLPKLCIFMFSLYRISGFKISLVRSSETINNDSRTSGIPAGLVRWTTAYFWFSHKLHWLYIFQTSEWYIRTSNFYNPLARRTSAFNLKFRSLNIQENYSNPLARPVVLLAPGCQEMGYVQPCTCDPSMFVSVPADILVPNSAST